MGRVARVVDDRRAGGAERVLERGADGVDRRAAALAHALRPERRERRRRLDLAGLERRHVHRVRHVVVVEVGRQQVPFLVVGEGLVGRCADAVRGGAHHLPLDDLWMDAGAAVVDGGVVDDLVRAGLRVDLEDRRVHLRRVRQRQVAVLALDVGQLERRHVDETRVQRQLAALVGEDGVVRVHDRPERHERERSLGVVAQLREAALEHDVFGAVRAEDAGRQRPDVGGEPVGRALDRAEAGDGELARVGAREAGVGVPVGVVADPDRDRRRVDAEDVGDDDRRRRLVALALRSRPEGDDDLAEDVELHRRDLVVARELQLRVDQPRLGEVVRAGVERRPDPEAEQLAARLGVAPAAPRARSYPIRSSATSSMPV